MQVAKNLTAIQKHINTLEKKGWHVRLIHDPKSTRSTTMIAERGSHNVTKKLYMGHAVCNRKDQFCRATGTRVAFDRMVHYMSSHLGRDAVKKLLA
jgi:Uri superfamily endonuclease